MNKLTTEQLLFAHRIGAELADIEPPGFFYKLTGGKWRFHKYNDIECQPSVYKHPALDGDAVEIDFTPLYDWIDHDGGECPVKDDDSVVVEFNDIHDGAPMFFASADSVNWEDVERFKLYPSEESDWPEQRADAIGQNGNDGEHYAEAPETDHSTAHHKRPDGTDLIDEWWDTYPPDVARVLMWEQVRKYHNRLGKKDPIHIEVAKMADYMARWAEKERGLTE